MKTPQLFLIFSFLASSLHAVADDSRVWTDSTSGRTLVGTIQSKSPDGSEVQVVRKDSGKIVALKTANLVKEDLAFVKTWAPKPLGIVITKQTGLEQAKGGFGIQIDELGMIFNSYKVAENDLAPHPKVVIFDALPWFTPPAPVTYLMPRGKAEGLLPKRLGPVSRFKAVAPGLPPGMILYNYDIRMGPYNRMTLMVDGADQVVTLQFKAANKRVPMEPNDFSAQIATRDFVDVGWGGAKVEVIGNENEKNRYLVNLQGKDTVTWFVPVPLIRQILFNVREKKKMRN